MPIDRDRFENASALGDPPTSERIIWFLSQHADNAYTRGEIADAISANPETVGTNLTRLKKRGLVRHRAPYWAITEDRDRVSNFLQDRYEDSLDEGLTTGDWNVAEEDEKEEEATTDSQPSPPDEGPGPHRAAARAFIERVRDLLEAAIDDLYVFGSIARSTETADSDVDMLAVISNDADYETVDDRLLDIAYDIQLEYGVRVEVHSVRADEFASRKARGDPFIRTVIEEGEAFV